MERRFMSIEAAPVELEERSGEPIKFVGYAARFYDGTPGTEFTLFEYEDNGGNKKRVVERIDSKAFDRMINDGDDVRLLFNHDANMLLARRSAGTLTLSVFPNKGLRYIGTAGDTSIARDLQQHIRRGDVTGSSFSFTVSRNDEDWSTDGPDVEVRTIKNFTRVFDVGPVAFPAYEATSAGLRDIGTIAFPAGCDDKGWRKWDRMPTTNWQISPEYAKEARSSYEQLLTQRHDAEVAKQVVELNKRALRVRAECVA